ncbi:MAG: hypothetical protein CEN90_483 [Parcubacteria group bacterium Licking1014_17]|nr:MAG: hypothetical protein CEN90_483 [Parcubacteria group bacterium Licking1014_17]
MDYILGIFNSINLGVVLFVLIIGVYSFLSFFIIYHLIRFGTGTLPKITAFVFFAGAIVLVMIAIIAYAKLDMSSTIELFKKAMIKTPFYPR